MDDMRNDKGQLGLQDRLMHLIADEVEIVRALEQQIALKPEHPEASKTLAAIHAAIEGHGESLRSQLGVSPGSVTAPVGSPIGDFIDSTLPGRGRTQLLSNNLRADFAAFNYAALGYAALFEMSLRLYVPALREIAPQHLQDYAQAARAVNHVIASVVAWELLQDDLACSCICPMCTLGACGCVSACTITIDEVWQDAALAVDSPPGFLLQAPRPGSQLLLAGVQGGDRLLEIDGQPVQKPMDGLAAIRRHAIGEEVRLRIMDSSGEGRDIIVRHLGDYPRD
jgi:PDZ domain